MAMPHMFSVADWSRAPNVTHNDSSRSTSPNLNCCCCRRCRYYRPDVLPIPRRAQVLPCRDSLGKPANATRLPVKSQSKWHRLLEGPWRDPCANRAFYKALTSECRYHEVCRVAVPTRGLPSMMQTGAVPAQVSRNMGPARAPGKWPRMSRTSTSFPIDYLSAYSFFVSAPM